MKRVGTFERIVYLTIYCSTFIGVFVLCLNLYLDGFFVFGKLTESRGLLITTCAMFIVFIFGMLTVERNRHHRSLGKRQRAVVRLSQLSMLVGLTILQFASFYYSNGLLKSGEGIEPSLIDALYFSIVTFTTLGYGDYSPPLNGRIVASTEALLGYIIMGFYIGIISSLISSDEESTMTKESAA